MSYTPAAIGGGEAADRPPRIQAVSPPWVDLYRLEAWDKMQRRQMLGQELPEQPPTDPPARDIAAEDRERGKAYNDAGYAPQPERCRCALCREFPGTSYAHMGTPGEIAQARAFANREGRSW